MHNESRAIALALAAVALWSTVATGFKLGLAVMAPEQLLFLGSAISLIFFWVVALICKQYTLAAGDRPLVVVLGLLNPALYYLVLFEAYDRLPAQIAQPLNYTWAIVLAVLAVPILGQRLTARAMLGLCVSYAGVVIVLGQGRYTALPDIDWLGVAMAMFSTVIWASYWLFNTRSRTPPVAMMAWSFTIAVPAIGVYCAMTSGWPEVTIENLFYGTWVGLIEMGVTFLLWQQALKRTQHAGRIGQLIFLAPFLSLVMIATVLGETIHSASIVGLFVIVAGITIANMQRDRS